MRCDHLLSESMKIHLDLGGIIKTLRTKQKEKPCPDNTKIKQNITSPHRLLNVCDFWKMILVVRCL